VGVLTAVRQLPSADCRLPTADVRPFPPHLPQKRQFGLEVDVMRQLQMFDEAGRLHVVAVREHEFLVLRGALALLGEFVGA